MNIFITNSVRVRKEINNSEARNDYKRKVAE